MDAAAPSTRAQTSRPEWAAWLLLGLGVISASLAAILIRYASGAEPLAISFWRCAVGAVVLLPFARWRTRGLHRSNLKYSVMAGAFLALHFATWITSVTLTSVAASVLLVSTTPVFVALASWWLSRERLRGMGWFGIGLTLVGVGLIGGGDLTGSSATGNMLALAGGAAAGGYLLAGAGARRDLGIIEYAVVAYAVAAVLVLGVCLVADVELGGYPAVTWWSLAGLIAGPQLLGHTVINFVLVDIDATTVSVTIMAEPIIATLMAFVLFAETPSALVFPGGVLILAGIYLVTSVRNQPVILE